MYIVSFPVFHITTLLLLIIKEKKKLCSEEREERNFPIYMKNRIHSATIFEALIPGPLLGFATPDPPPSAILLARPINASAAGPSGLILLQPLPATTRCPRLKGTAPGDFTPLPTLGPLSTRRHPAKKPRLLTGRKLFERTRAVERF